MLKFAITKVLPNPRNIIFLGIDNTAPSYRILEVVFGENNILFHNCNTTKMIIVVNYSLIWKSSFPFVHDIILPKRISYSSAKIHGDEDIPKVGSHESKLIDNSKHLAECVEMIFPCYSVD